MQVPAPEPGSVPARSAAVADAVLAPTASAETQVPVLEGIDAGFFIGLLTGEGHFGGDGRHPQITIRMHTRHEQLFRWLEAHLPGGRLYGPYHHGGRSYYQWMARGPYLREVVAPLVHSCRAWLDHHTQARFDAMCSRYRIELPGTAPE